MSDAFSCKTVNWEVAGAEKAAIARGKAEEHSPQGCLSGKLFLATHAVISRVIRCVSGQSLLSSESLSQVQVLTSASYRALLFGCSTLLYVFLLPPAHLLSILYCATHQ